MYESIKAINKELINVCWAAKFSLSSANLCLRFWLIYRSYHKSVFPSQLNARPFGVATRVIHCFLSHQSRIRLLCHILLLPFPVQAYRVYRTQQVQVLIHEWWRVKCVQFLHVTLVLLTFNSVWGVVKDIGVVVILSEPQWHVHRLKCVALSVLDSLRV